MRKAFFQYYETFEVIVRKFKTAEEREAMREIIINYGLYGTEPDVEVMDPLQDMAWAIVKDLIDQQLHRREVNAANRKKKQAAADEVEINFTAVQNAAAPETKPKKAIEKMPRPTVEEIADYVREKNYDIDAEAFYSYYEANGWKQGGKTPLKNWKAACVTWDKRSRNEKRKKNAGTLWQTSADAAEMASIAAVFK